MCGDSAGRGARLLGAATRLAFPSTESRSGLCSGIGVCAIPPAGQHAAHRSRSRPQLASIAAWHKQHTHRTCDSFRHNVPLVPPLTGQVEAPQLDARRQSLGMCTASQKVPVCSKITKNTTLHRNVYEPLTVSHTIIERLLNS